MVQPRTPFTSIAQMGAWDFWASPYAVGLSPEDAEAIKRFEATPEQVERARAAGRLAHEALIQMPIDQMRPS